MNNRALTSNLCKTIQVFTQNSIIPASAAGNIVSSYIRGDNTPLRKLTEDRNIPTSLLPLIQEIKDTYLAN